MKTKRNYITGLLSVFVLASFSARASDTNVIFDVGEHVHYSVTTTNEVKLGFCFFSYPPSFGTTNTVEQPIELVFSLPKEASCIYVPKNEYVGKFTLYNSNNIPLPKTALGESFKLKANLQWDEKLMRQPGSGTRSGSPEPWWNHSDDEWIHFDGWSRPLDFPKISQLFKIEKPGKYRLVLEVQVFLNTRGKEELVCFPPLEIPVIQPENTNTLTNASPPNQK